MRLYYAAHAVFITASAVSGMFASRSAIMRKQSIPTAANTSDVKTGYFDQLIDHDNPDLGTFSQMYYYSDQYWAGPGSPVVLLTPGETTSIDGLQSGVTPSVINGAFAQEVNGASILIEHRYFGNSTPFANQTTENLQYLTLKNSIADLTYFARNVELPFDTNHASNAPQAPWVLSGGSYSGSLSAWTQHTAPGTFWAYHATSAPVEAIYEFYDYFYPIQQGMPQNCSADVTLVVQHVNEVLANGTSDQKQALRDTFGLGPLTDDVDFTQAIITPLYFWQSLTTTSGYSDFYQWCDFVENAINGTNSTTAPSASGVGLEKALAGWANYIKQMIPNFCSSNYPRYWSDPNTLDCFKYNDPTSGWYTDWSSTNQNLRPWTWMLCNEPFAWWEISASGNTSNLTIVPEAATAAYGEVLCKNSFPPEGNYTYGLAKGKTVADFNAEYGGWDAYADAERIVFINGQFDPWRSGSISSEFRPGGEVTSTCGTPVFVIPGGWHHTDKNRASADANLEVKKVWDAEIALIKGWVAEFYNSTSSTATTQ